MASPSETTKALAAAHEHARRGHHDNAERAYERILNGDHDDATRAEAALCLGQRLARREPTDTAKDVLERAMAHASRVDDARGAVLYVAAVDATARIHRRAGRAHAAAELWRRALDTAGRRAHDRWRVAAARCAVEARDWDTAIKVGETTEHPHGTYYAARGAAELGRAELVQRLRARLEAAGRPDLARKITP